MLRAECQRRELEADDIMNAALYTPDGGNVVPGRSKNVNHGRVKTTSYLTLGITKLKTLQEEQQANFIGQKSR